MKKAKLAETIKKVADAMKETSDFSFDMRGTVVSTKLKDANTNLLNAFFMLKEIHDAIVTGGA